MVKLFNSKGGAILVLLVARWLIRLKSSRLLEMYNLTDESLKLHSSEKCGIMTRLGQNECYKRFQRAIIRLDYSQENIPKYESPIFMKFDINVVFKNIFHPYFLSFLLAIVDVEGVKTNLKIIFGSAEDILLNISGIIKKRLIKLASFNDEFNGVYHFAKKSFV